MFCNAGMAQLYVTLRIYWKSYTIDHTTNIYSHVSCIKFSVTEQCILMQRYRFYTCAPIYIIFPSKSNVCSLHTIHQPHHTYLAFEMRDAFYMKGFGKYMKSRQHTQVYIHICVVSITGKLNACSTKRQLYLYFVSLLRM